MSNGGGAFGGSGIVGVWEHDGDHVVLERESFDFVDDRARDLQLVLRDLLRGGEVKAGRTWSANRREIPHVRSESRV